MRNPYQLFRLRFKGKRSKFIKSTLFLALMMFTAAGTFAQSNSNGRVGIGTKNPENDFHVKGSAAAGDHVMLLENEDHAGNGLKIRIDGLHPLWIPITNASQNLDTGFYAQVPFALPTSLDAIVLPLVDSIQGWVQNGTGPTLPGPKDVFDPNGTMASLGLDKIGKGAICKGGDLLADIVNGMIGNSSFSVNVPDPSFNMPDPSVTLGPYSVTLPNLTNFSSGMNSIPSSFYNVPKIPEIDVNSLKWSQTFSFGSTIGSKTLSFSIPSSKVYNAVAKDFNDDRDDVNGYIGTFNGHMENVADAVRLCRDNLKKLDGKTISSNKITFKVPIPAVTVPIPSFNVPVPQIPTTSSWSFCQNAMSLDSMVMNFPLPDLSALTTKTLSSKNQFVTFVDEDDRKLGAIRGQHAGEWILGEFNIDAALEVAEIISGLASDDGNIVENVFHSFKFLNDRFNSYNSIGVVYESGNGDYAEWLERENHKEKISYGDIIGIKNGKISKDLTDAEQIMVVSKAPIVMGNAPEPGKIHLGNNVAFIGQVPVKVMGPVKSGDYIIPNPEMPGFGLAKSADEMTAEELSTAVGRSWDDRPGDGFKFVNTLVGMHSNAWATPMRDMQNEIAEMEREQKEMREELDLLHNRLYEIEASVSKKKRRHASR